MTHLALLCSSLIAATVVVQARPAFAVTASEVFRDVPPGHWAEFGVTELAVKRDLMRGYPDNTFRGEQPYTRFQFVDALWELVGELEAIAKTSLRMERPLNYTFTDIQDSRVREKALSLANDYGIFEGIPGVSAGEFSGSEVVTRYEMAAAVDNLMEIAEKKGVVEARGRARDVRFDDLDPTVWAYEEVRDVAGRYRVMIGFPDNTFRGADRLTRYEFAQSGAQTVPLIRELVVQTIEKKAEERTLIENPRWREGTALEVVGRYGATAAGFVPTAQLLTGFYPGAGFLHTDTRLTFSAGQLVAPATGATGMLLTQGLYGFWGMPSMNGWQFQPYLGGKAFADFGPNDSSLLAGPGYGLITYWRPSARWGFALNLNGSNMLLANRLGGAGTLPNPSALFLGSADLSAEYFVTSRLAITGGVGFWEAPQGIRGAAPTVGKDNALGFRLGVGVGF